MGEAWPLHQTRQQIICRNFFPVLPNEGSMLPNASWWVCGAWLMREKRVVASASEKQKAESRKLKKPAPDDAC